MLVFTSLLKSFRLEVF